MSPALLALAEAILPGDGARIFRADERTVAGARALLEHAAPRLGEAWELGARALDVAAVPFTGRRFRDLDRARQDALLARWEELAGMDVVLTALSLPLRLAHFDRPDVFRALGGRREPVGRLEQPRWLAQIRDGAALREPEELECDVVVVGTGAGGAVVGEALARRGLAVVFLEAGEHVRRDRMGRGAVAAHRELYRGALAVGRSPFPIFAGRLVGGSTAVNGGTVFRPPPWVHARWCEELGSDELSREALAPHFDEVERTLGVRAPPPALIGPIGDVLRRGCEALGWRHAPVLRNATGCEGLGFCDFGCRTDARRSTNLSYVPAALGKGALLVTQARADRVLREGTRVVGIDAQAASGVRVRVHARAVVLAMGALATPFFLKRERIARASGQLGRNLTLHPSIGISAVMDEPISGWEHVPQGCACDEHLEDGFLLLGAQPDLSYAAMIFAATGERLMERIGALPWTASFGVLAADAGKGHLAFESNGLAVARYELLPRDVETLRRAVLAQAEICLAAGAREVHPLLFRGPGPLRSRRDLDRLRRARLTPASFPLTSYHPLGTVRMGRDPKTSVVALDHQVHDAEGLFVVDGSVVSGPLGVNPQLTIMALARRAADRIAATL